MNQSSGAELDFPSANNRRIGIGHGIDELDPAGSDIIGLLLAILRDRPKCIELSLESIGFNTSAINDSCVLIPDIDQLSAQQFQRPHGDDTLFKGIGCPGKKVLCRGWQ
ncbi:hypothetical protein GCM10009077_07440 [Roseibium denhamense]